MSIELRPEEAARMNELASQENPLVFIDAASLHHWQQACIDAQLPEPEKQLSVPNESGKFSITLQSALAIAQAYAIAGREEIFWDMVAHSISEPLKNSIFLDVTNRMMLANHDGNANNFSRATAEAQMHVGLQMLVLAALSRPGLISLASLDRVDPTKKILEVESLFTLKSIVDQLSKPASSLAPQVDTNVVPAIAAIRPLRRG